MAVRIRDRIKEFRRVPAEELKRNPKNWRRHPSRQRAALSALLEKVGYCDAVVCRESPEGLELIDGHLRKDITPDIEIPVLILDVTEEEADLLLASMDPIGAMADSDKEQFEALAKTIDVQDMAIRDLLDGMLDRGLGRMDVEKGEYEISPELHERQDYLLVVVDNEFDWAVLCQKLRIGTVTIPMPDGCSIGKRGIGRVVPAGRLLSLLDGGSPVTEEPEEPEVEREIGQHPDSGGTSYQVEFPSSDKPVLERRFRGKCAEGEFVFD